MRIAVFIDWFAPAYKAGGPIQSIVNLVSQPVEGTEYRVVCSNTDLGGELLTEIEADRWVRFNQQTEVWYNSNKANLGRVLKELSEWNADVFFINGIYSPYYNFLPLLRGKAARKIISARGMLHAGALSQKGGKKKLYLALWRLLRIHRRHSFHATNPEEAEFIRRAFGSHTKIYVAQNLPRVLQRETAPAKQPGSLELVSVGLISPMKNYLKVIEALQSCPAEVNYTIYGPVKDPVYWEACQVAIKNLPPNVRVHYRGDLTSARVQEALRGAHAFVLPSKSENFGHAIFEALTAGLPVITSHNTPWNGLQAAGAGFNVSLENDYELSNAICFFAAADGAELARWSAGAKAFAEKAIDINAISEQYRQMFAPVTGNAPVNKRNL